MSLASGMRLGPYEVLGLVGAGGMGEVYKARDTRLDRTVAIKVLPTDISADPDRRARLEREAKMIAGLTHPHICTLHDVGEHAGSMFLVMEHLEGETLAHRLEKGALSIEQTLTIATDITDALAAAHRQGIIHRDLKPGNVMLTKSGAKLLDFGLAKLSGQGGHAVAAHVNSTPTRTALTAEGVIVGTVQYMTPEQLEGKEADARSDIFSFGAVLYEMLTGRRAFDGESRASVLTAVLEHDPEPLSTFQPLICPGLDRLVRKCLQKDPDARWQSAADVADELRWLASRSGDAVIVGPADGPGPGNRRWAVAALIVSGVLLVATAGAFRIWSRVPPSPVSTGASMRLTITLPPDMPLAPAGLVSPGHDRPALAISPDGSRLAYVALLGSATRICVRDMQSGTIVPLEHTAGGHTPFFSPDGDWIGFFADSKLKKVPSRGGQAIVLADAPNPWGATWASDGTIYFNRYEGEGIFRVAAARDAVKPFAENGLMPEAMDSGSGLFVAAENVRFYDTRNPSGVTLVTRGGRARYVSPGYLVYASRSDLMAARFDAAAVAMSSDPVTVFDDVRSAHYQVSQFTVSQSGTLVYVPGRPQGMTSFVWVDRKGRSEPLGLPEATYLNYALSPDGTRLAYSLNGEIWVWDRARRSTSRLTPRAATGTAPVSRTPRWMRDNRTVAYESVDDAAGVRLMAAAADGATAPVELCRAKAPRLTRLLYPMGFSPDGSVLSLFSVGRDSSFDLLVMPMAGSVAGREPQVFLGTRFGECFGGISPDGRWMLFASDQSGEYEVWMTTYPKPGRVLQISQGGGREPMWNPAVPGEVVYLNGRAMYAVDVSRGPDNAGRPQLLFEGAFPDVSGFGYDMAPDGRFLMLENKDILKPATTLTVVTNLVDELQRRLPERPH